MLDWVWRAFDRLRTEHIGRVDMTKPLEQLERDLTDLHFGEIQQIWAQDTGGTSAFYPDHEIPEFESRHSAKAQPPAYDLGFVLRDNPRCIWPIEAKVVRKASILGAYLADVRDKFMAGIAAPFVGEAGMIGYLLRCSPAWRSSCLSRSTTPQPSPRVITGRVATREVGRHSDETCLTCCFTIWS
jgi:hypothetical protein